MSRQMPSPTTLTLVLQPTPDQPVMNGQTPSPTSPTVMLHPIPEHVVQQNAAGNEHVAFDFARIKTLIKPELSSKAFHSAAAVLAIKTIDKFTRYKLYFKYGSKDAVVEKSVECTITFIFFSVLFFMAIGSNRTINLWHTLSEACTLFVTVYTSKIVPKILRMSSLVYKHSDLFHFGYCIEKLVGHCFTLAIACAILAPASYLERLGDERKSTQAGSHNSSISSTHSIVEAENEQIQQDSPASPKQGFRFQPLQSLARTSPVADSNAKTVIFVDKATGASNIVPTSAVRNDASSHSKQTTPTKDSFIFAGSSDPENQPAALVASGATPLVAHGSKNYEKHLRKRLLREPSNKNESSAASAGEDEKAEAVSSGSVKQTEE